MMYTNQQAQKSYMKNSVSTVVPGELTLMLYNGCIKFIKQAEADLKKKDYVSKNTNLQKAQSIIDELIITLKMEYPISAELRAIYLFIKEQLISANIKSDLQCLNTSLDLVTELRDTWMEALKILKTQQTVNS